MLHTWLTANAAKITPTDKDIYDYGLFLLDQNLGDSGHSLEDFPSMPQPVHDWAALDINCLIAEQLNYNRDAQQADLDV